MTVFPDTSFLYAIYREEIHSPRADQFMDGSESPLPVSVLLLFEFRNSVRLQQRLFAQDRTRGFPANEATRMLRALQSDLQSGVLEITPVDWADVHSIAERLSAAHTTAHGHRFADILHVATAVHLGAEFFLSFDDKQRALAEAEGMAVV